MRMGDLTERERILIDVQVNNETGCWEWIRSKLYSGDYGQLHWKGKNRRAHVMAHEAFIGPVNGMCVLHKCDVQSCCNPDHLFLGTRADNMNDKIKKGRDTVKPYYSRMKIERIQEFRRRRESGETVRTLADEAGVHITMMYRMTSKRKNTRYAHI